MGAADGDPGVPMLLGPILGPILGGWLLEVASWHWIGIINVPIGVGRPRLRLAGAAEGQPAAVGVLRLLGMAPDARRVGALPLRGLPIPGEGTAAAPKVWIPMLVGALLMVALSSTRSAPSTRCWTWLFKNRNLTVTVITMFSRPPSSVGCCNGVPTCTSRRPAGKSTLHAGLLVAPRASAR